MKASQIVARVGLVIVIFSTFFAIAITPWIITNISPEMGIYTGAICGFILLIFLLEYRTVRFLKGMMLIAYGVIFQLFFTTYFFESVDRTITDINDLKIQLDLYMQVLVFACAGAGGSIIANYADKSSSDYEQNPSDGKIIDNTKHIDLLIGNTKQIERKINLAITISLVSTLTTVIIAAILLFK